MLPDYLDVLERRARLVEWRAARARLLKAPFVALGSWLTTAWAWGTAAFEATTFEDDGETPRSVAIFFEDDGDTTRSVVSSVDDDWPASDVHGEHRYESVFDGARCHSADDLSEPTTNPATGLPMVGAVDVGGNPYGCSETEWSGFDHSEWWGT